VKQKLLSSTEVDNALVKKWRTGFRLGLFDYEADPPTRSLPTAAAAAAAAAAVAAGTAEAATAGAVQGTAAAAAAQGTGAGAGAGGNGSVDENEGVGRASAPTPKQNKWSSLGINDIHSAKHAALALSAAEQSMVLLQNRNKLLPLNPSALANRYPGKLAVIGSVLVLCIMNSAINPRPLLHSSQPNQ
jgi:beta-glucosidase-like glycosyl hydrolase